MKKREAVSKLRQSAVAAEIADTRKDLTDGSDAFYEAVGKRFTQIIDRTQVVDSVMHRTQFMRSSKVYNMAAYALYDVKKAKNPKERASAQNRRQGRFSRLRR